MSQKCRRFDGLSLSRCICPVGTALAHSRGQLWLRRPVEPWTYPHTPKEVGPAPLASPCIHWAMGLSIRCRQHGPRPATDACWLRRSCVDASAQRLGLAEAAKGLHLQPLAPGAAIARVACTHCRDAKPPVQSYTFLRVGMACTKAAKETRAVTTAKPTPPTIVPTSTRLPMICSTRPIHSQVWTLERSGENAKKRSRMHGCPLYCRARIARRGSCKTGVILPQNCGRTAANCR